MCCSKSKDNLKIVVDIFESNFHSNISLFDIFLTLTESLHSDRELSEREKKELDVLSFEKIKVNTLAR